VSFLALRLAQRAPSRAFTYGWGSGTIYAALFNVLLILLACGAIAVTACQRLLASAPPVSGPAVAVVALLGILVNGATAWALRPHHGHDLNLRSAYWHMMTDAAVSAGVAVTGLLVALTHFYWLDAAVSLAVVAIIVVATWDIVRDTLRLMLAGVPAGIDPARVAEHLRGMEGVSAVHDLHIWSISTKDVALTAHLVLPGGHPGDAFLRRAAQELQARFHIGHVTLQVENRAEDCRLAPDHVI
jgi:cobalt-zinc-cadmium efflux system protein